MKKNKIKYTSAYIIQKLRHRIRHMNFLIDGVSMFGVERFKDALEELGIFKKLKDEPYTSKDKDKNYFFDSKNDEKTVEFIVDLVIKDWKSRGHDIKREQIFKRNRRLEHTKARAMAMLLMKKHTTLNYTKIAGYFGRTRQSVFTHSQEHEIKIKNKNSLYFRIYNKLDEAVLANEKKLTNNG